MPFYEYKPKSGVCSICNGCFMDLQKMSEPAHTQCPECGQECERIISVPLISSRGAEYRAAANKERRQDSIARAQAALSADRVQRVQGHTHNCALHGCFGDTKASPAGDGGRLPFLVSEKTKPK